MKKRYSFGKKLTVCMLVLLLVMQTGIFAVYMLRPDDNALAAITYLSDLEGFLTNVDVFDAGGSKVNDGSFTLGEKYTFKIYYAESNPDIQLGYNGSGELTYQLPSNVTVPSAVNNKPILLANGNPCGKYSITTEGLVTVKFDEVDNSYNGVDNGTPGTNFIDNYFNVSFMLEIDALLTAIQVGDPILFGGQQILVNAVHIDPPKMEVAKSSAYSSTDTSETVEYTITITAPAGNQANLEGIKLADIPSISGTSGLAAEDVITDINITTTGTSFGSAPETTWTGGKLNLDFGDYELEPGKVITVTYTLDINKLIEKYNVGKGSSSQLSNLQYNFDIANAVSITADNATSVSKSVTRNVSRSFLSKTNNVGSNTNPSSITWTATVGTNKKGVLDGKTITDVLSGGVTTAMMPSSVAVKLYGA
ncbi:MAG: hypothetical protein FWG36_07340, partial [Oscillospiraceae bacterium]|nr:hypothetical protein [Oscillospiraceae bacterium]